MVLTIYKIERFIGDESEYTLTIRQDYGMVKLTYDISSDRVPMLDIQGNNLSILEEELASDKIAALEAKLKDASDFQIMTILKGIAEKVANTRPQDL